MNLPQVRQRAIGTEPNSWSPNSFTYKLGIITSVHSSTERKHPQRFHTTTTEHPSLKVSVLPTDTSALLSLQSQK